MTIHTVVLTASKQQGVAFGLNTSGKAVRIWLMTPRAVEHAMMKLEQLGKICGPSYAKRKQYDRGRVISLSGGRKAKEWALR